MGPDAVMQAINASISTDKRMWREDIAGSKAHADMLAGAGIISAQDQADIHRGLDIVASEIEAGTFTYTNALEDIHMHIEARLTELVGDAGKRLHTARSRNDQVATDFRLYVRAAIDAHAGDITRLISALIDLADAEASTPMPGFTHLQTAQPVTFGHHMMAYVQMFLRDRSRLLDARARLNESPLGSAALAGTGFAINRHQTAESLGFTAPCENSLDGVSARDFALEYLSSLSILAIHLSRLADEFVLWSSDGFGFVRLSDAWSTGSSIMPQKRNPDAAELIRAKSGSITAAFQGLAMVMKGLPLAYSKDMQEDKAPTFQAGDDMALMLTAMHGMVTSLTVNRAHMLAAAGKGHSTATDLADALVRELGMAFRDAHHVTGQAVKLADDNNTSLEGLGLARLQTIEPRITQKIVDLLSIDASLASRTSFGGTAPSAVRAAIQTAREKL